MRYIFELMWWKNKQWKQIKSSMETNWDVCLITHWKQKCVHFLLVYCLSKHWQYIVFNLIILFSVYFGANTTKVHEIGNKRWFYFQITTNKITNYWKYENSSEFFENYEECFWEYLWELLRICLWTINNIYENYWEYLWQNLRIFNK